MLKLAIIVPLYNPHNDWFDAICNSIEGLESILTNIEFNVVLVNDGSSNFDESSISQLKARTNKVTYMSYPVNRGKGYAIRYALNITETDYYIYTDIDFPFGYEIIKEMVDIMQISKANLVIGIRNKEYFKILPFKRKVLSISLHYVNFVLTRFRIYDTQAGIKGFDNEGKKVFAKLKTNGFLFDLEFIYGCLKRKLQYKLVTVHPRLNIKFSDFRFSIIKQEIRNMFKIIFRF